MPEIKSAGYSVYINTSIAKEINRFFRTAKDKYSKLFILVDENSLKHCYPRLVEQVEYFKDAELIEIESGEENKSLEVCAQIWSTLSELGADRHSLFVNLGGGVISDMGGFIASTFKRGIDFINIPTTLLSQVDASVGGKTGIDLHHLKNEIGVFSNPAAVFINSDFVRTLDRRQVLSGFAEMVKHALIADAAYWKKIIQHKPGDPDELEELIKISIQIKNEVVQEDPKEKGKRKMLNFGHTIGHAIETYSLENDAKKPLLHGEAIAAGMVCEAWLSYKVCGLPEGELETVTRFILKTYKGISIEKMGQERLLELMKHDKKNEKDGISFSLLAGIGNCEINRSANAELIKEALNYYTKEAKLLK
ncbi:MAG: 3-dehydroquinate synthase [Bacteroidetes bacterium]|nr:3-dehydroquinate synthase [Bacteroidota bacterium]